MSLRQEALNYHSEPRPGKISLQPTKPCETSRDLALAYSPGVAEPCLEIAKNVEDVYRYTTKGNLVAVITNGTAVLGLGDIGPEAAKPVMEGKGVLFKWCADIDVFDLELNAKDPERFIEAVQTLSPTFGGINLEDIKAPECFYIEEELQRRLDIPVFHDDQHGTAIISTAALLNALELTGRKIEETRLVVNGAGAAGIACAKLLLKFGMRKENLIFCDTSGVIYKGRKEGMNPLKLEFAVDTPHRTLADALRGADAFFGLSKKGALHPEMLASMAANPIVFAMANPEPEIEYSVAKSTRSDVIIATGRSDYPNQVNNVLGFPFIFRGALDVRASKINDEMKIAAVKALAALAKEPVPESVRRAYGNQSFFYGPEYLIPKPFDPRVLYYVAPAVAQAAMSSGVARMAIDLEEYTLRLKGKQNQGRVILRGYYGIARDSKKKRIVFPEGKNPKVIKAAAMAYEENIAEPVLLGKRSEIEAQLRLLDIPETGLEIIEPLSSASYNDYAQHYYEVQQRRGITIADAERLTKHEHIFANLMLARGDVEGLICGVDRDYSSVTRPILDIVGLQPGCKYAAGLYVLSINDTVLFLADTTMNIEMTAEKLSEVAVLAADFARSMSVQPRVAFLSFSNFGSVRHPRASMVRQACELARLKAPEIEMDGEMQADAAVVSSILRETYPFARLSDAANVLIFPDMQSGNIAFKLLQRLGNARVIGPVLLGIRKPAFVMQRHASVDEIFNMVTVAVARAAISS